MAPLGMLGRCLFRPGPKKGHGMNCPGLEGETSRLAIHPKWDAATHKRRGGHHVDDERWDAWLESPENTQSEEEKIRKICQTDITSWKEPRRGGGGYWSTWWFLTMA